jgi:hypothetical protein
MHAVQEPDTPGAYLRYHQFKVGAVPLQLRLVVEALQHVGLYALSILDQQDTEAGACCVQVSGVMFEVPSTYAPIKPIGKCRPHHIFARNYDRLPPPESMDWRREQRPKATVEGTCLDWAAPVTRLPFAVAAFKGSI